MPINLNEEYALRLELKAHSTNRWDWDQPNGNRIPEYTIGEYNVWAGVLEQRKEQNENPGNP